MYDIKKDYRLKRERIQKRLKEFEAVWKKPEKKIFSELCFCICTPQSRAIYCDEAIRGLTEKGTLFTGTVRAVSKGLKRVRFPNNKAKYIVYSRNVFTEKGVLKIKKRINKNNIPETREWLVRNVKGLGFKEASHFLRNIGFGEGLAILDVHILRNMKEYGVIKELPKAMSGRSYLALEAAFKGFAEKIKIPPAELDLLFWSKQTGEIFK